MLNLSPAICTTQFFQPMNFMQMQFNINIFSKLTELLKLTEMFQQSSRES